MLKDYSHYRICNRCHKLKPISEYGFLRSDPAEGRDCICKQCAGDLPKKKSPYVFEGKKEGSFRKHCLHCNGYIFVDPLNQDFTTCSKCGHTFAVKFNLKGVNDFAKYKAKGFRLETCFSSEVL